MNPSPFLHPPVAPLRPTVRSRDGAFALVITLLILSLLIIVAVSYLSSMAAERQTADAYDAKAVAEQAAQAGVDNATAMLAQSFRDFPDSVTVWDTTQTTNTGSPASTATVSSSNNEGTSLYLRAMPSAQDSTVADPLPPNVTYASGGISYDANDPKGNDPSNPACQTFVLPLISGVLNGQAKLPSSKSGCFQAAMDLSVTDPVQQTWTDLNVRRVSGDLQGAIGSPPNWTGKPDGGSGSGPKPARAYWIKLTGSDGRLTGRYAFWIEDNSFRANSSLIDDPAHPASTSARVDNTAQPLAGSNARSLQPKDISLAGLLTGIDSASATGNGPNVLNLRLSYPGNFFPDARAFSHASLTPPGGVAATTYADEIAYLTTNQSGTLNLSRHGTQRVNLNAVVSPFTTHPNNDPSRPVDIGTIKTQIEQIERTIAFHLPSFGQRLFRVGYDNSAAKLNDGTVVSPGRPLTLDEAMNPASSSATSNQSLIYLYKVATNIHDYIDSSTQPTIVSAGGTILAQIQPTGPPDEGANNPWWAQGKKATPFIDEVAVRYRPIVATSASPTTAFNYPRNHFDLCVDYYVELWNMSDRDVYALPQTDTSLPHLSSAKLVIQTQQQWSVHGGGVMVADSTTTGTMPPGADPTGSADTVSIDLSSGAFGFDNSTYNQIPLDGAHAFTTTDGRTLHPVGAVFPAGSVTVITTDPSCFLAAGQSYPADTNIYQNHGKLAYQSISLNSNPKALTIPNPLTTIYCSNLLQGQRHYSGKLQSPSGGIVSAGGLAFTITPNANYVADVSLVNQYGFLDFAHNTVVESGSGEVFTNTFTQIANAAPNYNDFGYCSSLVGNAKDSSFTPPPYAPTPIYSELGDPRTNNEQLYVMGYSNLSTAGNADQSRFFASNSTLGYVNNMTVRPDGSGPATTGPYAPASAWPDYFTNGAQTGTTYPSPGLTNAPMVLAGSQLTSIGQLGDVFDPARLVTSNTTPAINYSRGGGRTLKIGQHDDRYDPTANADGSVANSNGWAAWRLTDIFSAYPLASATSVEPLELPARININGLSRDNGAALRAALAGFAFQPATTADPVIHGDNHVSTGSYQSLATQNLNLTGDYTASGLPEIVSAFKRRMSQTPGSLPSGPFFERGEMGELVGEDGQYLFGAPSPTASIPFLSTTQSNTNLVNNQSPTAKVDMNTAFDHGREELFRRLSELICTRGDTFTIYTVGQSLVQPTTKAAAKITGTQRMRVTVRLVPLQHDNTPFHPAYNSDGTLPTTNFAASTDALKARLAKPDHYGLQVLEATTY